MTNEPKPSTRCERTLHLRRDLRGYSVQTRSVAGQLAFADSDPRQALAKMQEALTLALSVSHRDLDDFLSRLEA